MKQGWKYKKLGEAATFINGYAFKPDQWKEYGTPIVRIQNLNNPNAPYNYFDGEVPDKVKIQNGDLLISWSASLGAYIWNGGNAFLNQHIFKVAFDKTDVDKIYLKYAVTSKLETMAGKVHGATMKHIVKKDFDNTLIPYPPKSTQLSIVSELDKINELIRLKKEQLKDYDNLAQSIFYEMFGDPVENEKGWEVKKMKDVCTHIVDCPHSTPKKADTTTNYPCIRTSELKGGTISWSTMQYLEKDEYEKRIARLKPETGDIIFGREGTIGDAVILPSGYNFSLGQRTMLIRTDNEMIINTFMHRTLMSEWIKHQIEYVNVSSTVAHVNIKDFKLFDVPLPPLPLQHLFAQRIEQIERQRSAVQKSITDLETLLASRMQYWFE